MSKKHVQFPQEEDKEENALGTEELEKVTLGICCMEKKFSGKPMQAILTRLRLSDVFDIIPFPEEDILNKDPEEWPVVQCLIAFASQGFPLNKAIAYAKLRNPVLVNSLEEQALLQDRVAVYRKLQDWGIPCPDHVVIDHRTIAEGELQENAGEIIFLGRTLKKPFVEKPQDGDCHDIWIYYPPDDGGGAKKLFRKEKDRASWFDVDQNRIRRDGVYVYEPFLPTHGTDIKVYTVGKEYIHAEARKAPTIDGKVQRSTDGKEIRYPVNPSAMEKAMAALIVQAFGQRVCGFDILRTATGESIVCDVNGWSFVKGNQKYYNDAGVIIQRVLLEGLGITDMRATKIDPRMHLTPANEKVISTHIDIGSQHLSRERSAGKRLRCVIVVMRHADRRPKEKLKFKTALPEFCDYFNNPPCSSPKEHVAEKEEKKMAMQIELALKGQRRENSAKQHKMNGKEELEVRLKSPEEMEALKAKMEALLVRLRASLSCGAPNESEILQELENVRLLLQVLTMKDRFSGLERKVQLKATKRKMDPDSVLDTIVTQVQVVAKWGGELTMTGLRAAEELGKKLRNNLYPDDASTLLRLHSSFCHDFKCYSSQEGRCQSTAASFTKGFLALEGDPTPILAGLIMRDDYAQVLLDEPVPKADRDRVKARISELLSREEDLGADNMMSETCPTNHASLREATRRIGSPKQLLSRFTSLVRRYVASLADAREAWEAKMRAAGQEPPTPQDDSMDCQGTAGVVPRGPTRKPTEVAEDHLRMGWYRLQAKERRWKALDNDIRKGTPGGEIDASKIPEAWDDAYYDLTQSREVLTEETTAIAEELIDVLQPLNDWVAWSEYGISREEKLHIGADVAQNLLRKIVEDVEFMVKEEVEQAMEEYGVGERSAGGPDRSYTEDLYEQPQLPTCQSESSLPGPELRKAFLAPTKEWHPRLSEEVRRITGVKSTHVKSRIYVTSASMMHSLMNIFMHGGEEGDGLGWQDTIDRDSSLNYLTHLVFRCYESRIGERTLSASELGVLEGRRPDKKELEERLKPRYKIEISMSPGCMVFQDGVPKPWAKGSDLSKDNIQTAPLEVMTDSVNMAAFEKYTKGIMREYSSKKTSDLSSLSPSPATRLLSSG